MEYCNTFGVSPKEKERLIKKHTWVSPLVFIDLKSNNYCELYGEVGSNGKIFNATWDLKLSCLIDVCLTNVCFSCHCFWRCSRLRQELN